MREERDLSKRSTRAFGHEKLAVYQSALNFVGMIREWVDGQSSTHPVVDQLDRASESIITGIAHGNARWGLQDRNRHLDTAYGSALECAAAMDVCFIIELISADQSHASKERLTGIVAMLLALRANAPRTVRETPEEYASDSGGRRTYYFAHETLDVYKAGLDFVRWVTMLAEQTEISRRVSCRLEADTTSIVLNIAEGNGRFAELDHRRFLDIARAAALDAAARLDIFGVKTRKGSDISEGKDLLRRIVSMLTAMTLGRQSQS